MRIHLIRHGQTLANEKKLYCGQTDLPLTKNGAEEITLLKTRGIYPFADLFYTSGLLRTEQTIDVIYGNANRNVIPDIAEYKFGLFEMKSYHELKKQEDYQAWITDDTEDAECPRGESKRQFKKRVMEGYARILSEAGQVECDSAFVACHGGVIACIMEYLLPNRKSFYEWQPKPGRGYTLIYVAGRFYRYSNI